LSLWPGRAERRGKSPAADLESLTDAQLVERLRDGDESSLDEVIGRYGARVRTYLGLLVRDQTWAEDLTQETFVRVMENAATYHPQYPFSVWLFRIARNLAIDLLRRDKIHQRAMDTLKSEPQAFDPRSRRSSSPLSQLEERELNHQFEGAVQRLPESFRTVFLLRHFEGMSYEEIADVVGVPLKTVSTRLHRARTQLRHYLASYLGAEA